MAVATIVAAVAGALVGGLIAYFLGLQRSRYERLEERRALVVAELSRLVFEVQDAFFHWAHVSLVPGTTRENVMDHQEEKGRAAVISNNELIHCYHSNVAWLRPETAAQIEHFLRTTKQIIEGYGPDLRDIRHQMSPEGRQVANRIRTELPLMRDELIREFRSIVYPMPWWQAVFPYRLRFKASS